MGEFRNPELREALLSKERPEQLRYEEIVDRLSLNWRAIANRAIALQKKIGRRVEHVRARNEFNKFYVDLAESVAEQKGEDPKRIDLSASKARNCQLFHCFSGSSLTLEQWLELPPDLEGNPYQHYMDEMEAEIEDLPDREFL